MAQLNKQFVGGLPKDSYLENRSRKMSQSILAGPAGDHRAAEYTALADDASMSGPQKEAFMLCSAAEVHLEEGDAAECIKKAEEALAKFKGFGKDGSKGMADALHLIIDAHRLEAYNSYKSSDAGSKLAEEELAKFKADGDKRGQAKMLLAQRELASDKPQLNKRAEGLETVEEALGLAKEVGDKKLEARCLLASAMAHYTSREGDKMADEASSALAIYEELNDVVGKGKALHVAGLSDVQNRSWDDAHKKAAQAKTAFAEAGKKYLEAGVLHAEAIWYLMEGKAKKAAPLAEQALAICQGLEKGKRAEAVAAFTACEAHCEAKNAKNALKIAKEEVEKFQKDGSKMEEAIAQEAMTIAHLASDAPEKAVKTIESARKIAEELGAKRYESRVMVNVAAAHLGGKEKDEAYEALEKASELAMEDDDLPQLALVQREMANFCMFEKHDYKEALKMANEAVDTAQKDEDKVGEGMGTMLVALCQALNDEAGKALTAANEAQELYQEAGFPAGEGQALWMIAELKAMDDKYEAALEAAEERLSIFRDMKDLKSEAKTLELVASLHLRDQNYDEAEKVCKEAVPLAQKADDAEGEVQIQLLLTKVYLSQVEDPSSSKTIVGKAAKVANDAVGVATKTGDKAVKGIALYWKAQTLMMDEKHQDALKTANEAEALFKGSNEQGQAACLHLVGTVQQNLSQPERALETLEKGLALAQACKDADLEYELATSIYNLQRRMQPAQPMMMDPAMMQQMMPAQGGGGGGDAGKSAINWAVLCKARSEAAWAVVALLSELDTGIANTTLCVGYSAKIKKIREQFSECLESVTYLTTAETTVEEAVRPAAMFVVMVVSFVWTAHEDPGTGSPKETLMSLAHALIAISSKVRLMLMACSPCANSLLNEAFHSLRGFIDVEGDRHAVVIAVMIAIGLERPGPVDGTGTESTGLKSVGKSPSKRISISQQIKRGIAMSKENPALRMSSKDASYFAHVEVEAMNTCQSNEEWC